MENIQRGGIDNTGHYRCFFCDGEVLHTGTDMAIEVYPDSSNENDVLHYMRCNKCGAEYEVIQKCEPNNETPMGDELELRKRYFGSDGV